MYSIYIYFLFSESEMAKSIDSALSLVKCYQQEGRSKIHNTPTRIYTPRECYDCMFLLIQKRWTKSFSKLIKFFFAKYGKPKNKWKLEMPLSILFNKLKLKNFSE